MKPHEMRLEAKFNGGNTALNTEGVGIVAYVPRPDVARFLAEAPGMALALLGTGYTDDDGEWHTETCHDFGSPSGPCGPSCTAARESLRKAGVLP